jgi:hypothetical protein
MNIAMKTLSALTIATAALAVTALPGNALPNTAPGTYNGIGHHPAPTQPKLPPVWQKLGSLHGPFKCLVCELPKPEPQPVGPRPGPDGGDHGWNQWHNRHGGPEIVVEGIPEATAAPAPSAPVRISAPAQSAPVRVSAPGPQAEPCNCLTKQSLPDGSVLFQDICTKESAIATPQAVGAR